MSDVFFILERSPRQWYKVLGSKSVRECGWHLLNFITFVLCHVIANSTHNSCARLLMLVFLRHFASMVLFDSMILVSAPKILNVLIITILKASSISYVLRMVQRDKSFNFIITLVDILIIKFVSICKFLEHKYCLS